MITLQNIELRRGAKILLNKANVVINTGEKVALIGANGAGKTSLFSLISGSIHEDAGSLTIPANWQLSQVAQNLPETSQSALEFVIAGDEKLTNLWQELKKQEQCHTEESGIEIARIHALLQDHGAHDAKARAASLIQGLGFSPAQIENPVNSFSGGWRMRLQLARALMSPSDILLLDEPTNHLDIDALIWLEAWLARYSGTLIIISHDKEFLDATTNTTLLLENQTLTKYGGNYSTYETLHALAQENQKAAHQKQQHQIAHLQKFIDRFKAKASKARQAQSRVKALEKMQKIAPVLSKAEFTFSFQEPQNIPDPMWSAKECQMGYKTESEQITILKNINSGIRAGQRIGILGANGQGKSTFIKTLAGQIPLISGQITEGKGLSIGYFAQQELDILHPESSPLEHMVRLAREQKRENETGSSEQALRQYLGSFAFVADQVLQPVGQFSGGEKARLVLAMLVWQRPNLLLLDEPTNHLDLNTRQALAMALTGFEGALLLVSHDRALLKTVCDEFWLVANNEIKQFDGDLQDYQKFVFEQAKNKKEEENTKQNSGIENKTNISPAALRKIQAQERQKLNEKLKPLKKEIEKIESKINKLNQEQEELHNQLSNLSINADEIANAGKRLKIVNDEINENEEKWLLLLEEIEKINSGI